VRFRRSRPARKWHHACRIACGPLCGMTVTRRIRPANITPCSSVPVGGVDGSQVGRGIAEHSPFKTTMAPRRARSRDR
jgi:hypothetical protein